MFAFGWSSCGRKPEYPEGTNLPDLVTTWPYSFKCFYWPFNDPQTDRYTHYTNITLKVCFHKKSLTRQVGGWIHCLIMVVLYLVSNISYQCLCKLWLELHVMFHDTCFVVVYNTAIQHAVCKWKQPSVTLFVL